MSDWMTEKELDEMFAEWREFGSTAFRRKEREDLFLSTLDEILALPEVPYP